MSTVILTIDGAEVEASEGETIIAAARKAGIYIPGICAHPDLHPAPGTKATGVVFRKGEPIEGTDVGQEFEGCQLCLVEIEGKPEFHLACNTPVATGMVVQTNTPPIQELRQSNLAKILATHPHRCLICPQREGCSISYCTANGPVEERCCSLFGNCELQKVAQYIGIPGGLPDYRFRDLPIIEDWPLFSFDSNLCIGCLRCVKACQELRGIKALDFVFDENGRVCVGTTAPTFEESGCKFCGACVEVCPTGALVDKVTVGVEQKEALVPCRQACPAGIDVPRYVSLIGEEKFDEAIAVVREKVPFPSVLGYACSHPCETECRRGEVNEAIAIRALKRYIAEEDKELWKAKATFAPPTGKKIAVIGSGPAGLTAAYYLAKLGHTVTVFESSPLAGGMMRMGISERTLPREILDKEIAAISDLGVQIKVNSEVDSVDELFEEGYDAIFVAVGAPNQKFNQVFTQRPDMVKEWGLQGTDQTPVEVNPGTLATDRKGIFAGGDVVRGPASVKKRRAS